MKNHLIILVIMKLSPKQDEMISEIKNISRDKENYMKHVLSLKIPKMFSSTNKCLTLNYEDYLGSCKINKANMLKKEYNLNLFMNAFDEITSNEILLYRHKLEKKLQEGLHALMEIQFLDSFAILRNQSNAEKLVFSPDLKNIMFLMKNLVKFFDLHPPTVANELYEEEKEKAIKELNIDLRYKSPELVNNIAMNIKLKALSISLAKQHKCQVQNKFPNKGNKLL